MTQSPYPSPQYPYRVVTDPAPLCRRAGIVLFVLGMLVALYGIGNTAVLLLRPPEELMAQLKEQMPPGNAPPFEVIQVMGVMLSCVILAFGLAIMILSGPVRRGKKGAVLASMIVVGIVGGFVALMTACSAIGGLASPATFAAACCFTIPLSLAIWLFVMLLQAHRALTLAQQAMATRRAGMQSGVIGGFPPVYPQGPGASGSGGEGGPPAFTPPASPTTPASPPAAASSPPGYTMFAAPLPPPGAPSSPHLFGPAPFGIPPPPDELPPGRYGYATRPPAPPPPAAAPPPPPQEPPAEPPAAN